MSENRNLRQSLVADVVDVGADEIGRSRAFEFFAAIPSPRADFGAFMQEECTWALIATAAFRAVKRVCC